ncbi:MAG: aminomethyl-transferring glycine dehydrogenase, partial [Eubacteriales bacterium]|nr:aminomethyl-transferring glycine dehydrogenase [Eubacteriales bacterium]
MGSFLPTTAGERQEMLKAIGLEQLKELYRDVPESVLLEGSVDIPEGLPEMVVRDNMEAMAARSTVFPIVLRGAGSYDH